MSTNHNVMRIIAGALLSGSVALAGLGLSMGTAQAFNPQPDPPGKVAPAQKLNPGEIHGFNPQTDPPGLPAAAVQRGTPLAAGEGYASSSRSGVTADSVSGIP